MKKKIDRPIIMNLTFSNQQKIIYASREFSYFRNFQFRYKYNITLFEIEICKKKSKFIFLARANKHREISAINNKEKKKK